MAVEIERKFLVAGNGWRAGVSRTQRLRQGYLSRGGRSSVRVRIVDEATAWLTIKSAVAGRARLELEYPVPIEDARLMLTLTEGSVIDKVRHDVTLGGQLWQVDVFAGDNAGLVVAEVELERADQLVALPDWLGAEVTDDRRYYNASLATHPFTGWTDAARSVDGAPV